MRTLYLDCGMGAAGDMLTAALLELLPQPEAFVERLNGLGIPGVTYHREKAEKCGITGTHITVTVDGHTEGEHDHDHNHEHHHHHSGMEGALASVIGGLADCPVIAVPTSVGYGASFGGVSALLSMLNSCASGVSVVNIDNGFGAGYLASMINHMEVKK